MLSWLDSLFKKSHPLDVQELDARTSASITPAEIKSLTLGQKQRRFSRMVADLIIFAYENGYEVTLGDAYRDPRLHGHVGEKKGYGSANSLHKDRLAIDLNLFKNGKFLTASEDHKPLGQYWESLGGSWGGRFNDGNHYSVEHGGRK